MKCFLVAAQLLAIVAGNFTNQPWEHKCDPGSEIYACTVANFLYRPGRIHSTLQMPVTVRKVRLAHPPSKVLLERNTILAYDAVLHTSLHRPKAVQIRFTTLEYVEISVDLEYADFHGNSIKALAAPEVGEVPYALRYLDVSGNKLETIANFSTLVRLETLLLTNNYLATVDGSVLRRLTQLSGLHVGSNMLEQFPLADLPGTLEWLVLRMNLLTPMNLTGVQLPALQVLSLAHNYYDEPDVEDLLVVAPKLKVLLLAGNDIAKELALKIADTLRHAGVAVDKLTPSEDAYEEEMQDHYRSSQMHEVREHIFATLLAIGNGCVMVWGGFRVYRARYSQQ
uniref:Leucine rich immune protein (Coil-less) n=1 Tax=Anopheles dirus TaxID=7168 RepID=A0A182N6D7_9DIPT